MFEESTFIKNLFLVAKELDQLKRARECKQKFESDFENLEQNSGSVESKIEADNEAKAGNFNLNMEVYEDKDYDIEEIRFWNFNSKNKVHKPNIIRTLVYKYPESSYLTKKCPVYLPADERTLSESAMNEQESAAKKPILCEKSIQTGSEDAEKSKTQSKLSDSIQSTAQTLLNNLNATSSNKSKPVLAAKVNEFVRANNCDSKFNADDLIMIDDDEDVILNYKEFDDEELELEKLKQTSQIDIIKEEEEEKEDESNNDSESADQNLDQTKSNSSNKVNKRVKRSFSKTKSKPKLVIEKACEPISTINIVKVSSSEQAASLNSRPRRSSNSQTLEQMPAQVARRVSQRLSGNDLSAKKAASINNVNNAGASASCSNSSVDSSTSTINSDRSLRSTRSRTKLLNNSTN